MARILVTNDDGIYSEGLRKLAGVLKPYGEVIIVAPDREQSAASHALTLNRPLRLLKLEENEWIVDGTPSDCVNLAVLVCALCETAVAELADCLPRLRESHSILALEKSLQIPCAIDEHDDVHFIVTDDLVDQSVAAGER